jgi:ribosomal-protein-alanine N-acetyltransferase
MTRDDVPDVLSIERASTASPWTEAAFQVELQNAAAKCRVARGPEGVAGFLVAWHLPGESQVAELGVRLDFRRRGCGRSLLRDAVGEALSRGASVVTLEVRAGNEAGIKLYESEGFAVVGRRPKYYEGREDAILMEKKL